MEAGKRQLAEQRRPVPPIFFRSPTQVTSIPTDTASVLDPLELESLMLNLDASLGVNPPHHFFAWTQVLLSNRIQHQLLIPPPPSHAPITPHVDTHAAP